LVRLIREQTTRNTCEDGDCGNYVVVPGGRLLDLRLLTALAVSEPSAPLADSDHYREMAGRLRGLARQTCSPGIRRELVDLAKRYDRRGNHFDRRSR
jgi:hypothetical protein